MACCLGIEIRLESKWNSNRWKWKSKRLCWLTQRTMTCDRLSRAHHIIVAKRLSKATQPAAVKCFAFRLYFQLAFLCHSDGMRVSRFDQMKCGSNVRHTSAKNSNPQTVMMPNGETQYIKNQYFPVFTNTKLLKICFVRMRTCVSCLYMPFFVISQYKQSSPSRFIIAISSQRYSVIFHNSRRKEKSHLLSYMCVLWIIVIKGAIAHYLQF